MIFSFMPTWCTPIVLFCVSNLIIATLFISSKLSNTKTTKNQDQINTSNASSFIFGPKIPRVSSFLERAKSIDISKIIPNIVITAVSLPILPFKPKTAKYTPLSRLAQSIFFTCSYDDQPDCKRYPSNKPKPSPSLLGRLKSIDFSSIYTNNTNKNESEKDISDSLSQPVQDRVDSIVTEPSQLVKVSTNYISDSPSQLVQHRVNSTATEPTSHLVKVSTHRSGSPSQLIQRRVKSTATESTRLTPSQLVKVSGTPKKHEKIPVKKTVSEVRDVWEDEDDLDLRRTESARAKMNADDDAKADNFISKFRDQLKMQRLDSLGRYNDMLRRPS